mmetsp:Transcript_113487/g.321132  ORF Transcript_113487/g.321132 Transcript_113487/m.321132 type:complete len:236 (+) Transcript_113487:653-1360(+)
MQIFPQRFLNATCFPSCQFGDLRAGFIGAITLAAYVVLFALMLPAFLKCLDEFVCQPLTVECSQVLCAERIGTCTLAPLEASVYSFCHSNDLLTERFFRPFFPNQSPAEVNAVNAQYEDLFFLEEQCRDRAPIAFVTHHVEAKCQRRPVPKQCYFPISGLGRATPGVVHGVREDAILLQDLLRQYLIDLGVHLLLLLAAIWERLGLPVQVFEAVFPKVCQFNQGDHAVPVILIPS